MKMLTRRGFTAAGILAALSAGTALLPGGCSGPFDPSSNEIECVYGPPPEDVDAEETANDSDDTPSETFDPSENELADVYGPPLDEETDPYEPDENMMACVYGPPPDEPGESQGTDG